MAECLFCSLVTRPSSDSRQVEEIILLENDDFYVKPALGQFIEGYVLIIPKDHYRTIAEMPKNSLLALSEVLDDVKRRILAIYDMPSLIFEHGAVCPQNRVGACIDHAHLHVLPFRGSLSLGDLDCQSFTIGSLEDLGAVSQSGSYLLCSDGEDFRCLLPQRQLESQYMRRVLARHLGLGDVWDWRKHPYRENIMRSSLDMLRIATDRELHFVA